MRVRVFHELAGLPPSYEALYEVSGRRCFFAGLPWFRTLVKTSLEPEVELRIYGLEDDQGRPQVILPLRRPAGQNGSRFAGRALGRRSLASLTTFQSCAFGPLMAPGVGLEALGELVDFILAERPGWDVIDLNSMEQDSPWFEALCAAFDRRGFRARPYFNTGKIFEAIPDGGWPAFLGTRRKGFYKGQRRKARKLERDHAARLSLLREPEEVEAAIPDFLAIHKSSWKEPDHFPGFAPELLRASARAGALRLGLLFIDGEAAASELWLIAEGRATVVSCSYAERFAPFSPGGFTRLRMMETLIDAEGLSAIDLGRDDADYKRRWLYDRRELWGIAAFNTLSSRGLWQLSRERGVGALEAVKARLRPLLKREKADQDGVKRARPS